RATRSAASALHLLLLAVDGGFHAGGGARILAHHLAEGGASGLLFLQRRERLSEPQQRIRRLCRLLVFAGDVEEDFRRVAILLTLEITLAKPVLGIADQRIGRIFHGEVLHGLLGERVILALHVADAEVIFVAWRVGRRCGRELLSTRAIRIDRRWRRQAALCHPRLARRQIE